MKKQILSIVLLLSVCTGQVVLGSEENVASVSLLEKYIPGARMAKKVVYGAVLFGLFGGTKALLSKPPTLCECLENQVDYEGLQRKHELYKILAKEGNATCVEKDQMFKRKKDEFLSRNKECFKQLDCDKRIAFLTFFAPESQQDILDSVSFDEQYEHFGKCQQKPSKGSKSE